MDFFGIRPIEGKLAFSKCSGLEGRENFRSESGGGHVKESRWVKSYFYLVFAITGILNPN